MCHKRIIIKLIFLFTTILTFISCTDEITQREYARVKTLEVDNISSSGARLNAKIISEGNGDIIEHGFVWDKLPNPTIGYSEKVVLQENIITGEFSVNITTTLLEGTQYFVRAFSKSDEYLVYGKNIKFSSLGSVAPKINNFEPKTGTFRDTIKISGKNFSYVKDNNKVFFKEIQSEIISSNDSLIMCIVPEGIADKSVLISVTLANQISKAEDQFKMISPELTSIDPILGTFGDTINISGINFSTLVDNNIVSFNGHKGEVVFFSKTMIKAILPTTIVNKSNYIEVTSNLQSVKSNEKIEMIAPRIDAISPESGFSEELLIITGDYFNPVDFRDTIILGSNYGIVVESKRKELVVRVPNGVHINRSFPVGVKVASQIAFSSSDFTLKDLWIQKDDIPFGKHPRYRATGFSIGDVGYVGLGLGNDFDNANRDFYKYDPKKNSWSQINDFGGGSRYDAANFVIDNYAYVGGGHLGATNFELTKDFWKYNPRTDQWIRIADMPVLSSSAVGLSVDGFGYICLPTEENNFWKYDPSMDEWTQLPDLKPIFSGAAGKADAGFVIGRKIYIYASGNSTGLHQLYEFDTNTLQWLRKADMIDSGIRQGVVGVSIKEKGYIFDVYSIHEYDPINDTWMVVGDVPGRDRRDGLGFEIDDKAYFGSGTKGGSSASDFWEFNPDFKE